MEEKKDYSLFITLLIIVLISSIISIGCLEYKLYKIQSSISEKISNSNSETSVSENSEQNVPQNNILENSTQDNSQVSYIEIEIEDLEAESFIADFGDAPPSAKIYLSNKESFSVIAGDQINDNGKIVNLICKWSAEDGSDKILYITDSKLGEQIEKLFDN